MRGSFGNGKFGLYVFEDFADHSQVMRKRHESGDRIFTKTQAEGKLECLVQMSGGEKQRAEATVARLSPAAMLDWATTLSVLSHGGIWCARGSIVSSSWRGGGSIILRVSPVMAWIDRFPVVAWRQIDRFPVTARRRVSGRAQPCPR